MVELAFFCVRGYSEGPDGTKVNSGKEKELPPSSRGVIRPEAPVSRPRFLTGAFFFSVL